MTHFGERLKALARQLGKEDQEIARDLGLSKAQMSHYTTGKRKVPSELLQKIVDIYGINPQFLFDENAPLFLHHNTINSSDSLINENPSKYSFECLKISYPYFPVAVSAGLPINIESITDAEEIIIPDELLGKHAGSKDIFFMRVNGESMNKIIPHDSLIAVKQVTVNDIKNGDIVVYSNGYDYSVKRFYEVEDKLIFKPESTDPQFTDYILNKTSEDLRLHGKVVTYIVNLD